MDYIRAAGVEYISENDLREALGIKEDEDIFLAIKKLRGDKDLLEELHANHISMLNDYADLGLELGIGSGDAESIKDYIVSLKKERDQLKDNLRITEHALKTVKKERDQLKEKCDKLKARANAVYGVSCGYSGGKEPAFRCDVTRYSWELGSMFNSDSIHVELDLTPNANYKGTFDLEDLTRYIQNYGSVDYQNAKAARAELAHLYKTVLGKEKLDRDLSPHEIMKAIHDKYRRREEYCDRVRELEQKLNDIKDICDEDSDVMNIIGE